MHRDVCKDVGLFLLLTGIVLFMLCSIVYAQQPTQAACMYTTFNSQGTSGADVTVSNTAIIVIAAYAYNCDAVIKNTSANDMRCGGSDVTSSAKGVVVKALETLVLADESRRPWYCIRTGSSDATANTAEVRTQ